LEFVTKNRITVYTISDDTYPVRLRTCADAPAVLFFKGKGDISARRILSIVGTRQSTPYGRQITEKLIKELSESLPDLLIISGLAYGIDVSAHRNALRYGLPTMGVLAHGLDRVYPATHRDTAVEMLERGGLLTDFTSGTEPIRENFLRRNRLIAGLSDATLVVESAARGGALVTADIAQSYSRSVFACPGRLTDERSQGCNRLIRTGVATLVGSAADIMEEMRWDSASSRSESSNDLFSIVKPKPSDPILALLMENAELSTRDLSIRLSQPIHETTQHLFELELAGMVEVMPGDRYRLK
jgi:DNA processing protein